jgi:protein-disulfide isomerase
MKPSLRTDDVFAGAYRVVRPIAETDAKAAYVARDTAADAERALEVFAPEAFADDAQRARFEGEARAASALEGERIVRVFASGKDDASGLLWVARELVDGESLEESVARRGALWLGEKRDIVAQIGEALTAAHAAGVAHGGLGPGDVYLATKPRPGERVSVKVGGFAVSKLGPPRPPWTAPEVLARGPVGPATDVWALGLLAFFMMTGKAYTLGPQGQFPPASARARELGWNVPTAFDAWFARCLALDPAARFPSARDATAAFDAIDLAALPVKPVENPYAPAVQQVQQVAWQRPPPRPKSSALPIVLAIVIPLGVIVVVFVVIALAGFSAYRRQAEMARIEEEQAREEEQRQEDEQKKQAQAQAAKIKEKPLVDVLDASPFDDSRIVHDVPVGTSPVRGPADALVTIVELSDYQCPFCWRVEPTIATLRESYGTKLRVVWKDFPITPLHPRAEPAAELAGWVYATKGNDAFWNVHDMMMADHGQTLGDDDLAGYAKTLGLDPTAARAAIAAHAYKARIDADTALGRSLGVSGAPTFFINGRKLVGAQPEGAFRAIIDEEMVKAKALVASGTPPSKVYETVTKNR